MQHQQPELILAVNKPLDWTSFDVVNHLKFYIKRNFPKHKNIKIGHAGTLDPLATGLLIICLGKATKQIESLQNTLKEYTGTLVLGATTPSYDMETNVDATYPVEHITESMINDTAKSFIGVQDQLPPVFSAKKINGKRAYESAREGKEVVMRVNTVEMVEVEITGMRFPEVDFRLVCSKGTYIRSFAHDFGKQLNSGAYLKTLCRTRSGMHALIQAHEVKGATEIISEYLSGLE